MSENEADSRRLTRKSAVGVWRRAEEFAQAGRVVHANKADIFDSPFAAYFLFGHAIELALKSFLVGHGVSEDKLKRLGHNLEACFDRARSFSGFSVTLSDEEHQVVRALNHYYKLKGFEYLILGSVSLPMLGGVETACFRLLEQTEPLAHQAARGAIEEEGGAAETSASR